MSQIVLDMEIYPRKGVYPKRVAMFVENITDGSKIDPIEIEVCPGGKDTYRLLDGAHRWHAYKEIGATEIPARVIVLDGLVPILYAAQKAIGPLQLTDDEARATARCAYEDNPRLSSAVIGKSIGRARRTVDAYIADLRATRQMNLDLRLFRMNRLGIPQERIAQRLGELRETLRYHLEKMAVSPNLPNADPSNGFTVALRKASPLPRLQRSMDGRSLLSGLLPWKERTIWQDFGHLCGVY